MRTTCICAALAAAAMATPAAAVTTVQSSNANALAAALQGSGVAFTSADLFQVGTQNGFFSDGAAATGIAQGVVLTTGLLSCIGSANTQTDCSGIGAATELTLRFTASSTQLFFNYAFGSEEYDEFVGSQFNDTFSLTLDGANYASVNLAQLPGGGGPVSINNVNGTTNSAFFRNNTGMGSLNLPIELDGLTTVLTASATNLVVGSNYTLRFRIQDNGDSVYDSAVFIQGSSVGVTPPGGVPEPTTWAMIIGGFGLIGGAMRRRGTRVAFT